MAYTDELEPVLEAEHALRLRIARRIAEEGGELGADTPLEPHLQAADGAIEAWGAEDEDEHDARAFRPLTPLQQLLAEHRAICDRIADIRDRRLS
ncbi:hypothetical protein [Bosea sp. (in: a-proteobacteria)]|jgi:hypothetical protein|uniref:hypothetical protein n=1 Tax=Bosea sp. (in: a-proteobacteria) TaxID=1871050 RepID=UPI00356AF11F